MTLVRIVFEPAVLAVIRVELTRWLLILQCKRKKAREHKRKAVIPKDDLCSLNNSALNVELVYIMLLGINTIEKVQNDSGLSTVAEIKLNNNTASVLVTGSTNSQISTYSVFKQSSNRSIKKP